MKTDPTIEALQADPHMKLDYRGFYDKLDQTQPVEIEYGYEGQVTRAAAIVITPQTVQTAKEIVKAGIEIYKMFSGIETDAGLLAEIKQGIDKIGKWMERISGQLEWMQAQLQHIIDALAKIPKVVAEALYNKEREKIISQTRNYGRYMGQWRARHSESEVKSLILAETTSFGAAMDYLLTHAHYMYCLEIGVALRIHVDLMTLSQDSKEVRTSFVQLYKSYFEMASSEGLDGSIPKLLKTLLQEKTNIEKGYPNPGPGKTKILEEVVDWFEAYEGEMIVKMRAGSRIEYSGDLATGIEVKVNHLPPWGLPAEPGRWPRPGYRRLTDRRGYPLRGPRGEIPPQPLPLKKTREQTIAWANEVAQKHRRYIAETTRQYNENRDKILELNALVPYLIHMREVTEKLLEEWARVDLPASRS